MKDIIGCLPATHKQLAKVMFCSELSEAEKQIVKWQFGLQGSFTSRLFATLASADDLNRQKLMKSYPEFMTAMIAWQDGDLAKRINVAAGAEIV